MAKDKSAPSTTSQAPAPKALMKAISSINDKLGGSGLAKGCRKPVREELDLLAEYIGGTRKEAMLFAAVLALNLDGRAADIRRLARFFDCETFRIARLFPKLHDLVDRGWLRVTSDDDDDDDDDFDPSEIDEPEYGVPRRVFEKLALGREVNTEEKLYEEEEGDKQDPFKIISKVNSFISNRYYDDKPFPLLAERINNLLVANENAVFVQKFQKLKLEDWEKAALFYLLYEAATGYDETSAGEIAGRLTSELGERIHYKALMLKGDSALFRKNIVSFSPSDNESEVNLALTDQTVLNLIGEEFRESRQKSGKNVGGRFVHTPATEIAERAMHYNAKEKKEIELLGDAFDEARYAKLSERLEEHGLPKGLTVIFHGAPGTGKTETVRQLARVSGRDLMMVDLSQVRDKWFGESEKNVKAIFSSYRQARENATVDPVLLINEADGLISTRFEVGHGMDQVLNLMQNILLEELEKFEGILVATTNLTQNMDKAFERRFLYKVKFEKPGTDVKTRIWMDKVKDLGEADARRLARNHDLSGGQIENVARKLLTRHVLRDEPITPALLDELAKQELLIKQGTAPVGFNAEGSGPGAR